MSLDTECNYVDNEPQSTYYISISSGTYNNHNITPCFEDILDTQDKINYYIKADDKYEYILNGDSNSE